MTGPGQRAGAPPYPPWTLSGGCRTEGTVIATEGRAHEPSDHGSPEPAGSTADGRGRQEQEPPATGAYLLGIGWRWLIGVAVILLVLLATLGIVGLLVQGLPWVLAAAAAGLLTWMLIHRSRQGHSEHAGGHGKDRG